MSKARPYYETSYKLEVAKMVVEFHGQAKHWLHFAKHQK